MIETLMDAVVVEESGIKGDWNRLALSRIPQPVVQPGEVLVEVEACSVNRADLLQRRGLYPPPPGASSVLGLDFAGTIEQKASDVTEWERGARVFGIVAGGGYGRRVAVPATHLVPIPENLDFVQAAAAAEVFFTAFYNLFLLAEAAPGETLLVHGGGSGVGTAAIQLAKSKGLSVITTAGTPEKLERSLALGASFAINYNTDDFAARVLEITKGAGVDVILDWIGAPYFRKHIELLKRKGRLVIIGLMGGHQADIPLAAVLTKRLSIMGSLLRTQSKEEKAALTRAFTEQVLPLLASGTVQPIVSRVYGIDQVEAAHQFMKDNRHFGKIVLTWQDPPAS